MAESETSYLIGYGCMTAAGQGTAALYDGLRAGRDYAATPDLGAWPCRPAQPPRLCLIPDAFPAGLPAAERLAARLAAAWSEAAGGLAPAVARRLGTGLGVIFASAKGSVEDAVWTASPGAFLDDTLAPVLAHFLARTGLVPVRSVCVSNACSSTHVALQLAHLWLGCGVARTVLVLAADEAGPFVASGFASLNSLAARKVTPFGACRDGIQLGEAAAALLLTRDAEAALGAGRHLIALRAVDTRAEGYALTRSSEDGESLAVACRNACPTPPDLIVAHGTGTVANDAMEAGVYYRLYGGSTPVTCTKWSVGHCLGASGAVDVIAAAEALRRGAAFAIGNTGADELDPAFRCRFLPRGRPELPGPLARVLVATVGFGGMHGAALLEST